MAEVTLQGIRRIHGKTETIPPLDLAIRSGEFIALVGPSGSGKSTLLRMIAGLEPTDGGRVLLDGVDITDTEPAQRDMAMVFQSYALYPHMDVAENLTFALRMRGLDPAEIERRLKTALASLGLDELQSRRPAQLSGGQRQRVALARALMRQPRVFLLDEPLSNLDAKLRAATRLELRALHDRLGATTIFVTHDQVEAMTMADRVVVLDRGRIQQVAPPREVYHDPVNRFVASFIGSPEINLLRGRLAVAQAAASLGGLPLPGPLPPGAAAADGTEVELGIRPEHLALTDAQTPGGWPLEVLAVEFAGHDAYVTGETPLGRLTLRLDLRDDGAEPGFTPGQRLSVRPRAGRWMLFDPATGRRLDHA